MCQNTQRSYFSTGQYANLNLETLHVFYILEKTKGLFTKSQSGKLGKLLVVAYGLAEVARFFTVFPGGQATVWPYLELFYFAQKQKSG